MNTQELAAKLNGVDYGWDTPRELRAQALADGLVICYGASDDLLEFEGAINEELDACGGTTAYLTGGGLVQNECDDERCPYARAIAAKATKIEAEFDGAWTLTTAIPHARFDVMEGGKVFSRGIVFALADVPARS